MFEKSRIIALLLLASPLSFGGHSIPLHTDGIEPYYRLPEFQAYLDKLPAETRESLFASETEMEWWKEARFGFFVHWGPSSMLPCSMSWGRKGPRPGHSSDGTVTKGIPQEVYDKQYKKLAAPDFDADQWISLVKASGAKYFIFTAKHHDGFCLFDTKLTDYDIMNTPFGRDILKELTDACHKHGIKVALYYSQPDWNHPVYAEGDYDRYCDEYLHPQIRELMTNYGKIDVLWFDGLGKHPDTWKSPELITMVKKLQPGIILNHRWGPGHWYAGDFDGPERSIGRFQTNRPWETCTVIGGGWAWMGDAPAMPLPQAISLLVRCAGGGGNLALGVGPNGDGKFLPDHEKRLREMGQWLGKHGEAVYGTQGGPFIPGPWGAATSKGATVYLHVLANWSGTLTLPALPAKVVKADSLTGGEVRVEQSDKRLKVLLKREDLSGINTIIALTLDRPAAEIAPIKTVGLPLTIGAEATASSEKGEKNAARSVVAGDMKEFSEGIFVKSAWSPAPEDEEPRLQVSLPKPATVEQVRIREGKFGSASRVEEFAIEARVNGAWKMIHSGRSIGGDFGLVLPEAVTADAFRLRVTKWQGGLNINSFELFAGETGSNG